MGECQAMPPGGRVRRLIGTLAAPFAAVVASCGQDPLAQAASRPLKPTAGAIRGAWSIDPQTLTEAGFNAGLKLARAEGLIVGSRDMDALSAELAQRYELAPPVLVFEADGRASFDAHGDSFSGTWSVVGHEVVVVEAPGIERRFKLTGEGLEYLPGRTSDRTVRFVRLAPQAPAEGG